MKTLEVIMIIISLAIPLLFTLIPIFIWIMDTIVIKYMHIKNKFLQVLMTIIVMIISSPVWLVLLYLVKCIFNILDIFTGDF